MRFIICRLAMLLLLMVAVCGKTGAQTDNSLIPKTDSSTFNRVDKPFGLYLSVLGDPLVSELGLNAAYNANEYLRLTGGIGYLAGSISSESFGVGIKALLPHAEFSPVIGLNASAMFANEVSTGNNFLLNGNTWSQNSISDIFTVYINAGFDYQTKGGFDLGFGVNTPAVVTANEPLTNTSFVLPYLNLGMYF